MQDLVIMGTGQMGRWFAEASVRAGRRVVPVRRGDDAAGRIEQTAPGTPVVVTVPESALADTLSRVPPTRRGDVVMVQNGLFATDLASHGVASATVLAVWTLRKDGQPYIVAQRTGAFGPHASAIAAILAAHDVPVEVLETDTARDTELVAKYGFILAVNALGYARDATVAEWLRDDGELVASAVVDGVAIASSLAGGGDADAAVVIAMNGARGFGGMRAAGRSAAARVTGALMSADARSLEVPALRALARRGADRLS